MDTNHIDVTPEQFQAFQEAPIKGPFQMLNLLRFKNKVEGTDVSGAQAYAEYMRAAQPFFEASGAKIIYYGKAGFTLIGPTENEWDKILIVEYANKDDFLTMITSEGYPSALRAKAVEDSRLILCRS